MNLSEETTEWVSIDALLRRGEYPVIIDVLKLGQSVRNLLFFLNKFGVDSPPVTQETVDKTILVLKKLKSDIEIAVQEHTGLKIERRLNQRDD